MQVKRIYEGMFLLETGFASNQQRVQETIARLMDRAKAELLYCKKWDERRLAYEIENKRRGVYILTFFQSSADSSASLERDVQLTDGFLRMLILRRDKLTEEKVHELAEGPAIVPVRGGPDFFGGPPGRTGRDSDRRRSDRARPGAEGDRKEAPAAVSARSAGSAETPDRPKTVESETPTGPGDAGTGDAGREAPSDRFK